MSVRLIVAALLAATIVTAEPSAPKKALTVKSCNDNNCNCDTEGTTKYVAGECKEKDNKYWRLDSCDANQDATLTSFFTDEDCKGTSVQSDVVKKECTAHKHIKAVCEEGKVKLMVGCAAGCNENCNGDPVVFEAGTCHQYDGLDLYFKVAEPTCTTGTQTIKFKLFTTAGCTENSADPTEIDLTVGECTPFIHTKATCEASTAKIQKCYGKGECTSCTTLKDITLKEYTDYNSKVYYIDKCPDPSEADLTFQVFETSKKPVKKTIHPDCQTDGNDLHTMGTCADDAPAADPNQPQQNPPPKDVLTMKSECAEQCKTCKKKETYAASECKAHGDKFWRLEKCPQEGEATVTVFASDSDCSQPHTEEVVKACTAEKHIKAVCAEQKVKLMVDCTNSVCDTGCKEIEFGSGNGEDCKQYENRELYFKLKTTAPCDQESVEFELYTQAGCTGAKVAALQEIDLTVGTCTAFVHKQATCENTAVALQECYGKGACTSCAKEEITLKKYTEYNDKVYYIDKCPDTGAEKLTFKVFETSNKPVEKTITHECAGTTADQYTTSTCGADAADPQDEPTKDALTVVTECNENQCADQGCKAKSYKLNECVEQQEEGGSNKVYYKATCGETPTLHRFTTKENCNQNQSPEAVPLPKTTCEQKDSKYQRVVCPEGDDAIPKKPIITVKKSCTDAAQCTQCNDQESDMYIADGACQEQIVPPAAGAEANAAPTKTSYIAECDGLTLTTFTDAKCKEGKKVVQLPKTCTEGSIATCTKPDSGSDSGTGGGSEATTSSTAKSDNDNGNDNDNDNGDGSGDGSGDGKNGSGTTSNTTSNDSGIDAAPAAHSVGAVVAAFVLLALTVVC